MTATTPTHQPTAPDWLTAAEAAHQEQRLHDQGHKALRVRRHADLINARLAELGIEPIEPAAVDDYGNLQHARLTVPEYEPDAYYEVRAGWSEDDKQVELRTADWEDERPRFGRVGLLHSLADVAAARRETPTFPAPARDYRQEAIRAMDNLNVDRLNNAEVEAIVTAVHGNIAALLHIADTVARNSTTA
ncbi:hypothetical protein ACWCQP_44930 [Streptomyces chartreusis]